jgi:hypothetical protein
MPTRKIVGASTVYQLKVTLRDSHPTIWRRIQVSGDTTLAKLHHIVQEVMGWTDSHLHQFIVNGIYIGVPDPDDWTHVENEKRFKLSQIVPGEKFKFVYEYDFGDSWEHTLVVEKILPPEPGVHYPVCLKGKGACPPEDCGGIYGYYGLLEALQQPDHPEHDEMLEWVGGEFDPEAFDLDGINQALRLIR